MSSPTTARRRKVDRQDWLKRNLSSVLVILVAVVSVTGIQSKAGDFESRINAFAVQMDLLTREVQTNESRLRSLELRSGRIDRHFRKVEQELEDLMKIRPQLVRSIKKAIEQALSEATA